MTTNLQIAYADIPFAANEVIASAALDGFCSAWDIVAGERYCVTKFAANATSNSYIFDLGAATGYADYFIVAHADLTLIRTSCVATLYRSEDDVTYTSVANSAAGSLIGPRSADYLTTFAQVGPYRYWKLLLEDTTPQKYPLSKIFIGSLFNFSFDPDYKINKLSPAENVFYATSGAEYRTRNAEPYYVVECTWEHQTDAVAKSFDEKIVARAQTMPVFLVNTTETQILDSKQLIHARLLETRTTKEWSGLNTIYAKFEEIVA